MKPNARTMLWWLGGMLLAALVAAWLVSATEWATRDVWEPPHGEAAEDRFFLLKQLAQRSGSQVRTLHRFDELPPEGATLLLATPYWHFLPEREAALRAWVERGGQLVAYRSVADDAAVTDWVPVRFRAEPRKPPKPPQQPTKAAAASAPTGDGDNDADADEDDPEEDSPPPCPRLAEPAQTPGWFGAARQYNVCAHGESLLRSTAQPVWSVADDIGVRAMRLPIGRGSVTLSAYSMPPVRAALLDGDKALLLAAMLQLRPGQLLWIVDDEERPALLTQVWQAAPAGFVLLVLSLALLLWRWSVRSAPLRAPDVRARRSMAEQVRGTAAYLLRHGPAALHRAQWRALDEAAQAHVRGWRQVRQERRAALLAKLAGLPPAELDKACEAGAALEPAAMGRALALMEAARRRIVEPPPDARPPPTTPSAKPE